MDICIADFLNNHPQCKQEFLNLVNTHPCITKIDFLPILNLKNTKPICCGCLKQVEDKYITTMFDNQAIKFCSLKCMAYKVEF